MTARKSVKIRMYNVGFGDCFLILGPTASPWSILVDAGFHSQGKGAFSSGELAEQVIADVTALTKRKRVDVVIGTHRHQDHITSFNAPAWDELEVGEVWLPWVEDRRNPKAVRLWKKQRKFAMSLHAAMASKEMSPEAKRDAEFMLWNAGLETEGNVFGVYSNQGALDRLHEGFAHRDRRRPRFLPETEDSPETFETDVLPGVKVHVLGPARDPDLIDELDPERDGETYRALALVASEATGETTPRPFADVWTVPRGEGTRPLDENEEQRIADLARAFDPLLAAHALDDMINSTSLVLVLEIGKAKLLLPGDAEWGTWKMILENEDARTLLRGTTFLKVGHHGSHNATPKTLVEDLLRGGTKAMVSTQEGKGNYRKNIPLPDLLDAFHGHGIDAARSDVEDEPLPAGFKRDAEGRFVDLTVQI